MDLLKRLTETYKNYNTRVETKNGTEYFVILNPFGDENIEVMLDEVIFRFSFQHAHFDEEEDSLFDYIDDFLSSKQVSFEFFVEGTDSFGGSRYLDEIDTSSGTALLNSFTDGNKSLYTYLSKKLKGANCRCSIRAWNSTQNRDIDFTL
ncbi:MAG: hypothetical protein LBS74_02745 [Oscillospiraceae bacterium]|jgi:hypothetical protein|nr:hypothetical protein [Oscillospiraceae bacterium]